MHIEERLTNIEAQLATLIGLAQNGPVIAGAGAEPAVAQQVSAAIAAAGGVAGTSTPEAPKPRGRGRPAKPVTETAPPAAAATPVVTQPDPFATDDAPTAPVEPTRSLEEVRTALIVYGAKNGEQKALELMKTVAGVETLTQLKAKPESYNKLFLAAIPAGKFDINDVKAVLVKAEERKAQGGFGVLTANGAQSIKQLTEDKYVKVINEAHGVR